MTWENRGLQEGTGGYNGLQGVTRGYMELQGVTRGYRGLQGVRGADKWLQRIIETFFLTRTFPDTFCWSIWHKNQS